MSGSGSRCPRLFEAEAMRDGRLTGTERASYEHHASGCAACAREVRALESLAAALRGTGSEDADELRVRRERTRLLAAFDGGLVAPEGGAARGRSLLVVAAAACVAMAVSILFLWPSRTPAPSVRATARVDVHAEGDAQWSDRREGDRETLLLQRGKLRIHVDHTAGEGRLVVVLPDGELEDVGTTFTVSAKDDRTERVAVEEGRVLLRLRGRPAVVLDAGETWAADAPPPSESSAPAQAVEAPRAAAAPRSTTPPPAASAPSASADVSAEFRAAMSAFDEGDNRDAAAMFAAFLRQHPGEPRAEDAAYLRVIALQRSGDAQAMQQAAMTYLRLYPAGFRRAEIEPLAR